MSISLKSPKIFIIATTLASATYLLSSPDIHVIDQQLNDKTTIETQTHSVNHVSSKSVLGYESQYGPLPNSLEGTIMQQAVLLDENGQLLISQDLMRIFNFFLSTSQEEDLDIVINRVQEYLAHYLQGEPLNEALLILEQYIDMKTAMFDFEQQQKQLMAGLQSHSSQQDGDYFLKMEKLLKARNDIRLQYLSAQIVQAFFGRQDQLDAYTLSRMKVLSDSSLSHQQKATALNDINAQAPAELVKSREETQLTNTLKQQTSLLKEEGGSEADIRALRVELVGEEATQRYEELDLTRAQWQSRVDNYLKQRQTILAAQGITTEQQAEQIQQLRSEQFDAREQIRVKVYERNAGI